MFLGVSVMVCTGVSYDYFCSDSALVSLAKKDRNATNASLQRIIADIYKSAAKLWLHQKYLNLKYLYNVEIVSYIFQPAGVVFRGTWRHIAV